MDSLTGMECFTDLTEWADGLSGRHGVFQRPYRRGRRTLWKAWGVSLTSQKGQKDSLTGIECFTDLTEGVEGLSEWHGVFHWPYRRGRRTLDRHGVFH